MAIYRVDTGVYLRPRLWGHVWTEMLFALDPESWPPKDMGEYCHEPFYALLVGPGPHDLGVNEYGPAVSFVNGGGSEDWSTGFTWQDASNGIITGDGTVQRRRSWTVACGWNNFKAASTVIRIWQLTTQNPTQTFHLGIHGGVSAYVLKTPGSSLYGYDTGLSSVSAGETGTCVITVDLDKNKTLMYANGKYVAGMNQAWQLYNLWRLSLGGVDGEKEDQFISGTIGPFLVVHGHWDYSEAAEFHADPWGFLKERDPQPLVANVQTRLMDVHANLKLEPRVGTDSRLQPRLGVDAKAEPRVGVNVNEQPRLGMRTGLTSRIGVRTGLHRKGE